MLLRGDMSANGFGRSEEGNSTGNGGESDVLRTDAITLMHGFGSMRFGLRTRSRARGGRRIGFLLVILLAAQTIEKPSCLVEDGRIVCARLTSSSRSIWPRQS